jgi:fatty acid desaturase
MKVREPVPRARERALLARPVPSALNLAITAAAGASSAGLLWLASHSSHGWVIALCAVGFSLTANTLFSLFHEAVHEVLHEREWVNEWVGRFTGAWFPQGLLIQRAFHLTHHRHNRTDTEQFDYIKPGDRRWLKLLQWYAILTGVLWPMTVLSTVIYAAFPGILRMGSFRDPQETSGEAYFGALDKLPKLKPRLELLGAFAFQAGLFWALDLSFAGWLACYAAFALQWSSLQYADHAFTPLHVREGAWNLRVNPVLRAFFLNYHHHLAHHRHPQVSWRDLDRFIVPGEPNPRFFAIWLEMWKGPKPLPEGATVER